MSTGTIPRPADAIERHMEAALQPLVGEPEVDLETSARPWNRRCATGPASRARPPIDGLPIIPVHADSKVRHTGDGRSLRQVLWYDRERAMLLGHSWVWHEPYITLDVGFFGPANKTGARNSGG